MYSFLATAAIAGANFTGAAVAPPTISTPDALRETNVTVQPATTVSLGAAQIIFESSTFADIARFGSAPIGQRGDASEFVMWECFTLSQERQRLWLTSSELGGRKFIDGAVAELIANEIPASPACPELPGKFRPVHLDFGVWLGTSIEELKRHFGRPTSNPDGTLYFSYVGTKAEYDVLSTLIVRVKNKRVVAIHASHTTTN